MKRISKITAICCTYLSLNLWPLSPASIFSSLANKQTSHVQNLEYSFLGERGRTSPPRHRQRKKLIYEYILLLLFYFQDFSRNRNLMTVMLKLSFGSDIITYCCILYQCNRTFWCKFSSGQILKALMFHQKPRQKDEIYVKVY